MAGDALQTPRQGLLPVRDQPWLFRTYAGHSSARASNALFRTNLARGQTGLSIAFDLPTQTGYDSDHLLAKGEVGKVGVPVGHLGDMLALMDGLPLDRMNTSMTINATAPWLFALYVAAAESTGVARPQLQGTTQNDIIKEYLSRGTYIFPPQPSLRLTSDLIAFACRETPKWNPVNVCSYHLQEAGATPEQELAYALATAVAILDCVRASGQVPEADFARVVGRISFFVNAGLRFVTELCKMRAFGELWKEIVGKRYGVVDPDLSRFRYGVQVNSLGLTEQQPENNVYRILLETLAVTLSRDARARAVQLPAWNEALGLPRPWDQQWSLRLQQILAFETDLLDYADIFDGSRVIAARVAELKAAVMVELDRISELGGAIAGVESGYMKRQLVESNARRLGAIETGEQKVVGVNCFVETAPSPLTQAREAAIFAIDPRAEREHVAALRQWRQRRDANAVASAIERLEVDAREGRNIMDASIACAHAGVTTGQWASALRSVFGEYRAPTGVVRQPSSAGDLGALRARVDAVSATIGRRIKLLVGKPGLDGHSNGAEQIALRAKECGIDVVYDGIRVSPGDIAAKAMEEGAHVVGLSILSGSHLSLVGETLERLRALGLDRVPVVVGGIIPKEDAVKLLDQGVAHVYTPKDYDLNRIVGEIVDLVERTGAQTQWPANR
jgi:(2R)-ethylmalonyl-CoA mutase